MNSHNPTRNNTVDALRFLCAAGIVTHHAAGAFITENNLVSTVIRYSFVYSVNIFFIISGYAISESLKFYKPDFSNAIKYVMRRSIRLDAPYWVILTIYFTLETLLKQRNYGLVDLFGNGFYLQRIFGFQQILGVAWTLCIEVQFYLLMLLIASFNKTIKQLTSIYAILIVGSITLKYSFGLFSDGNFVLQYLPWFIVGIIASSHNVTPSKFSVLLVAGVLISQCVLDGSDYRDFLCTTVYGTVAYLLMTNLGPTRVATKPEIVRLRSTNIGHIAALGSYTYSIYLTHMLAIKVVSKVSLLPNASAKVVAAIIATTLMAWLLHHLIEKPALLLSRKISYQH
jgi:peptidoglycan/LPS O-acetylase OafA/YrhL